MQGKKEDQREDGMKNYGRYKRKVEGKKKEEGQMWQEESWKI